MPEVHVKLEASVQAEREALQSLSFNSDAETYDNSNPQLTISKGEEPELSVCDQEAMSAAKTVVPPASAQKPAAATTIKSAPLATATAADDPVPIKNQEVLVKRQETLEEDQDALAVDQKALLAKVKALAPEDQKALAVRQGLLTYIQNDEPGKNGDVLAESSHLLIEDREIFVKDLEALMKNQEALIKAAGLVDENEKPIFDLDIEEGLNQGLTSNNNQQESIRNTQEPVNADQEQTVEATQLVDETSELINDTYELIDDGQEPGDDNLESVSDNQSSNNENQEPVNANQEPVNDHQKPTDENTESAIENQKSTDGIQEPTITIQNSTADLQYQNDANQEEYVEGSERDDSEEPEDFEAENDDFVPEEPLPDNYCGTCGKGFKSSKTFLTHMTKQHSGQKGGEKGQKRQKAKSSSSKKTTKRGERSERAEKPDAVVPNINDPNFLCNICDIRHDTDLKFRRHLRFVHQMDIPFREDEVRNDGFYYAEGIVFTCPLCQTAMNSKNLYLGHLQAAHGMVLGKPTIKLPIELVNLSDHLDNLEAFFCRVCKKKFDDLHLFRMHLMEVHQVPLTPSKRKRDDAMYSGEGEYIQVECRYCDARGFSSVYYRKHLLEAHFGLLNPFPICKKPKGNKKMETLSCIRCNLDSQDVMMMVDHLQNVHNAINLRELGVATIMSRANAPSHATI